LREVDNLTTFMKSGILNLLGYTGPVTGLQSALCGLWPAQLSLSILSRKVSTECRCQRHVKPPTWKTSD